MENNASNKTFKAYLVTNLYPYEEMYEVKQEPDYCGDSVEEVKDKIIDDVMNSRHGDWAYMIILKNTLMNIWYVPMSTEAGKILYL